MASAWLACSACMHNKQVGREDCSVEAARKQAHRTKTDMGTHALYIRGARRRTAAMLASRLRRFLADGDSCATGLFLTGLRFSACAAHVGACTYMFVQPRAAPAEVKNASHVEQSRGTAMRACDQQGHASCTQLPAALHARRSQPPAQLRVSQPPARS